MASGLLGRRDLRPPGEPASRRAPERRGRRHADPYDGLDAHRPDGPPFNLCLDPHPSGLPADTLPPQLDQLVALVRASGRAPDAVVITIGANDTSWAGIAEGCYKAFLGVNCLSHRDAIKASLKPEGRPPGGEPNLAERYAMLAAALNHLTEVGLLRPHRVWITDYWDATRDDRNGLWVSKLGLGYARACPPDDPVPGIEAPTPGPGLRRFAHLHIIKPLNAAVRRAAKLTAGI